LLAALKSQQSPKAEIEIEVETEPVQASSPLSNAVSILRDLCEAAAAFIALRTDRDSSASPVVSDQDIAGSQALSRQLRDAMDAVRKHAPSATVANADGLASEHSALLSRASQLLESEYMITVRD
jgi:hypothetical protein